jgi:hypothetical protein
MSQSALIDPTVFTEFTVNFLVNVILIPQSREKNPKIVF